MGNGDDIWINLKEIRRDITNLARDGCGHKEWHEKVSDELRRDLITERGDRTRMGEYILKEMKDMKEGLLNDNKAIRNQIFVGMIVLMILTLVVDKVLK